MNISPDITPTENKPEFDTTTTDDVQIPLIKTENQHFLPEWFSQTFYRDMNYDNKTIQEGNTSSSSLSVDTAQIFHHFILFNMNHAKCIDNIIIPKQENFDKKFLFYYKNHTICIYPICFICDSSINFTVFEDLNYHLTVLLKSLPSNKILTSHIKKLLKLYIRYIFIHISLTCSLLNFEEFTSKVFLIHSGKSKKNYKKIITSLKENCSNPCSVTRLKFAIYFDYSLNSVFFINSLNDVVKITYISSFIDEDLNKKITLFINFSIIYYEFIDTINKEYHNGN